MDKTAIAFPYKKVTEALYNLEICDTSRVAQELTLVTNANYMLAPKSFPELMQEGPLDPSALINEIMNSMSL